VANCNNKLIGARYYKPSTQTLHWTEFNSARDSVAGTEGHGGHGSHTSSTAGGNGNVAVQTAASTWARLRAWRARASPPTRCAGPTP
jgi:hypothetical protein